MGRAEDFAPFVTGVAVAIGRAGARAGRRADQGRRRRAAAVRSASPGDNSDNDEDRGPGRASSLPGWSVSPTTVGGEAPSGSPGDASVTSPAGSSRPGAGRRRRSPPSARTSWSGRRRRSRASSAPWTAPCDSGRGRLHLLGGLRRGRVLGREGQHQRLQPLLASRSATVARALTTAAEILARLRTIRASCISRASSSGPNAAIRSASKPWKTSRNASRLLRIVDHDSPDWNASRVSRSRYAASPLTRLPHSCVVVVAHHARAARPRAARDAVLADHRAHAAILYRTGDSAVRSGTPGSRSRTARRRSTPSAGCRSRARRPRPSASGRGAAGSRS